VEEVFPDVVLPISDGARREVCVAIGASTDEVLWLTAPPDAADRSVFLRKTAAYVHSFRAGPEVSTRRYESRERPHFVQRTRDGLLFVSARTRDDAPNGWVMNEGSRVVRRLSLGDGLSDLRVSPAGTIWTSYFDEGVFGSGDGAEGLVARDHLGRKVWAYDAQKAGTDDVADVYAFNLSAEDDAWVYFYVPFSIVRWRKRKPTVWRTRVEGALAMAVRPTEALLLGDYDDPTSLRILDLPKGGGSARVKRRMRLRLPEGTDVSSIRALGAADRLMVWSSQSLMILQGW
jgi:hypothetical protein